MRNIFYCFLFLVFLKPFPVFSQAGEPLYKNFRVERERILRNLKGLPADSSIILPVTRYFDLEVKTLYATIAANTALPAADKDNAFRSLVYFMTELSRNLQQQKMEVYDIPGALQSYKNILTAILDHKPWTHLLRPLEPRVSQLMASSFAQYKEYALMDDIAVYKRVASSPEFILQFLESKPNFRFADSLLLEAAVHDPLKVVYYLNKGKPGVQEQIRDAKNVYLQQIASLSGEKQASELLPFVAQIAANRMTPEEILKTRMDATKYFQLLVNTLISSVAEDPNPALLKPLRSGLKQKALAFYVNEINDLHSAADAMRFASVKDLRAEDLYYIMTSCGEELYTSSYLGLYKRLKAQFTTRPLDSLFDRVNNDNFHVFMRLAANYNVLADFLRSLPAEKVKELLNRFMSGIGNDVNTGLVRAMDIGDSFGALASVPEFIGLIETELRSNLDRSLADKQYLGVRLYNILIQVFELVRQDGSLTKLWKTLGNYEILKRDALANRNGEVVELVLFYGDDDGIASFSNFQRLYTDTSKWEISKNKNWISIRSRSNRPLSIYANMPLDIKEGLDINAQDNLMAYLEQQSLEPTFIVHRGHSYHLEKTLRRLGPSVRLAILGSCGGYNKAISIATMNPDVQVIGSKKTGSKSINDPIIAAINEILVNQEDLNWPDIWKKLNAHFSKDEATLNLFNEYFPPSNNIGLFVLKLFKHYNRST